MKFKTHHWVMVAILLIVIWAGLMAGLSCKYLLEKDPVPVEHWTRVHRPE